jgi:hypothetical protein
MIRNINKTVRIKFSEVDKSGVGAGFLRVLRFPLPILIPPISPQSPSPITRGWYNRPVLAAVPKVPPHKLKKRIQKLCNRRRHFDTLFLINVTSGNKYCPSVLETVGLRFPTRNIYNFNLHLFF